jgi:hypothetical protein
MTRWERLEGWLHNHNKTGTTFTVQEYAADEGLDVDDASADIQSYLSAQRVQPRWVEDDDGAVKEVDASKTTYVLRRLPGTRTRNAQWAVGIRTADARLLGAAFSDDVRAKVLGAMMPDIKRISALNPRTGKLVEQQMTAVVDYALPLLEMASLGMQPPGGFPDADQ